MALPGWNNAEHCVQMRAQVEQLAVSQWAKALDVATEIPLPWYRVQSLATIARSADDDRVDDILEKACAEAFTDLDQFRRVAVLSWVVDAALVRNRNIFARRTLLNAAAASAEIVPAKSRGAALELLLEQAVKIGEPEGEQLANALLDVAAILATDPAKKWRKWSNSYVNRTVEILSRDHSASAKKLFVARFGLDQAVAILARHSQVR